MSADNVTYSFWTVAGLCQTVGGIWQCAQGAPHDPQQRAVGVSIDTRTLHPGELFIALRGERFDGHTFVHDALHNGAIGAMVERSAVDQLSLDDDAAPLLVVDDTLAALQQLARQWRNHLRGAGCRVIAVAGSNGKTTTRHIIHSLLHDAPVSTHRPPGRARLHGTQSPKSFNNHIGVPLTLLAAPAADDFVVVEVGTNHPGEVAQLAALVQPDVAVIVSIGREHLEAFGDVTRVAQEELSLLQHVQPNGVALIPADDWLDAHLPALPENVTLHRIQPAQEIQEILHAMRLPGKHAIHNAAAAVQVARTLGVDNAHLAQALARIEPVQGRFQIHELGALTLIDDSYNANPDSVGAALDALSRHWPAARRRVVVLGDMLELGDAADEAHREVGRLLAATSPAPGGLVTVGPLASLAASEVQRHAPAIAVHAAEWHAGLPDEVADVLQPGDVVLLKGSRSMALERLIPAIERGFGATANGTTGHGAARTP